jgi:hypothetical protein
MCFGCVDVAVQSDEFADFRIIESVLLAPARLREKNAQAKYATVETFVFLYYFSICVISVTRCPSCFICFNGCWPEAARRDASQSKERPTSLGSRQPLLIVVALSRAILPFSISASARMWGDCRYREPLSGSMTCQDYPSWLWPFYAGIPIGVAARVAKAVPRHQLNVLRCCLLVVTSGSRSGGEPGGGLCRLAPRPW